MMAMTTTTTAADVATTMTTIMAADADAAVMTTMIRGGDAMLTLWKTTLAVIAAAFLLTTVSGVSSQTAAVVPDVRGLNVPQAAALLNQNGLLLGTEDNLRWTPESGVPENTVSGQSVAAGETVAAGTAVNVTVARPSNITLIYDENDITLINRSAGVLDFRGLFFNAAEGNAAFEGTEWRIRTIAPNECAQLWSVTRYEPKEIEGCERFASWIATTTNTGFHFWTQMNGVSSFRIIQSELERASCPAAPFGSEPMTCDLFLAVEGDLDPLNEYVWFSYSAEHLAVINPSRDAWLPLQESVIFSAAPALGDDSLAFAAPALFTGSAVYGRTDQLAPGQCLLFSLPDAASQPPLEGCTVLAQRVVQPQEVFWRYDFDMVGESGEAYTCPVASPDYTTSCVLPR
jgi:hypothetical protein